MNDHYTWNSFTEAAPTSDLAFAFHAAELADEITMTRFAAANLHVTTKPDLTPVSDADLTTEEVIRGALASFRPEDTIIGEEFGGDIHNQGRQWIIDPIDGTKNYVRGIPIWATLICLLVDSIPQVAVVSAPALGSLWWAERGKGSYRLNHRKEVEKLSASQVSTFADASLAMSSPHHWDARTEALGDVIDQCWRVRGYGDFYIYCLLAQGSVDIALEPEVSIWDLAAPALIVTEAGGIFTDLNGNPGPAGGSAVAANPHLHAAVIAALNKKPQA